jgi:hypothetical protein
MKEFDVPTSEELYRKYRNLKATEVKRKGSGTSVKII